MHASAKYGLLAGLMILASQWAWSDGHGDSIDLQESLYIYPSIGYHAFDSDRDLDDAPALGAALGYQFSQAWGTELAFSRSSSESETSGNDVDVDLFHVDVLYHFLTDGSLRPFLIGGWGNTDVNPDGAPEADEQQFNLGLGLKHLLSDKVAVRADLRGLNTEGESETDALLMVGLNYALDAGKKVPLDSDGDGVIDKLDQCPATPAGAPVDAQGCPLDSDNDGVFDYLDQCPSTAAGEKVDANGCALDSDGDGVTDVNDQCPNTPEGIKVGADGCGLDTDGDGVFDSLDQCLETPKGAKIDENGCRLILTETVSVNLEINFASNSAEVPEDGIAEIIEVAEFMRAYPDTKVTIEGHTDDRGAASYNQKLSQKRADAVAAYLLSDLNIATSRVSSVGYGEAQPIADNSSAEGRLQNRRVVAKIETTVEK